MTASYNGNIGIDMRPAVPRLTMDEHMAGIDIAKLMKDYADSKLLSGKGNVDMKLAASGRSGDALVKTLTGTAGLNLQDGAVEGVDVWYAIGEAQSLIKNRQLVRRAQHQAHHLRDLQGQCRSGEWRGHQQGSHHGLAAAAHHRRRHREPRLAGAELRSSPPPC